MSDKTSLKLGLAQFNPKVGDVQANALRVMDWIEQARLAAVDLLIFPELALSGYPPEDLLLRDDFIQACDEQIGKICQSCHGIDLLIGHPTRQNGHLYNCASHLSQGHIAGQYFKQRLPNYQVFDEQRYFEAGNHTCVLKLKQHRLGILICEDVWSRSAAESYQDLKLDAFLVLNASPYHLEKRQKREAVARLRTQEHAIPIVYVNQIGGQDDLVFDGASFVVNEQGEKCHQSQAWHEGWETVDLKQLEAIPVDQSVADDRLEDIWKALVTGTRDYVLKSGFRRVCLGLSGGIDSALTLAIAVDALGPEQVHALMLPTQYTAELSHQGAQLQAEKQGVKYDVLEIESQFQAMKKLLSPVFGDRPVDVTEENLQSRIRGTLLMAVSNKLGCLLLATGNKSELATGYATLYGDMNGGYAPIKDCYKTVVYKLARWRNRAQEVIPWAVIERPPSAELAPDQQDSDSLPDYAVLDDLLYRLIEKDQGRDVLLAAGFDEADVDLVTRLLIQNEYKRRQGAPGPKITERAFGRDRRYPICSGWKP